MGCIVSASPDSGGGFSAAAWRRKAEDEGTPKRFTVRLHKGAGDLIGASLGNTPTGAVIFNVHRGGLLDRWNRRNPHLAMGTGFIIEEVNGVTGYWELLEALRCEGPLVCRVFSGPPESAGDGWFARIEGMAANIEQASSKGPFMLRLLQEAPGSEGRDSFCSLPGVRAGACGTDRCAVCLEEVSPDEILMQLPCSHAYHAVCVSRWLSHSPIGPPARRQCCPLCCRMIIRNPSGGLSAVEPPPESPDPGPSALRA